MRHLRSYLTDESGFTLAEVIAGIVVMGIVAAIAIPGWFTMVDNYKVESATSQLASDLRLANARATNRLETWEVVLPPKGDPSYCYTVRKVGASAPCTPLPLKTQVDTTVQAGITFRAAGSALVSGLSVTDGISTVTINSVADASRFRTLKLVNDTSIVDTRGRLP